MSEAAEMVATGVITRDVARENLMLECYRARFNAQFRHHPHREEIVNMLCIGGNPPELVQLWFTEAGQYMDAARRPIRGAARHMELLKERRSA